MVVREHLRLQLSFLLLPSRHCQIATQLLQLCLQTGTYLQSHKTPQQCVRSPPLVKYRSRRAAAETCSTSRTCVFAVISCCLRFACSAFRNWRCSWACLAAWRPSTASTTSSSFSWRLNSSITDDPVAQDNGAGTVVLCSCCIARISRPQRTFTCWARTISRSIPQRWLGFSTSVRWRRGRNSGFTSPISRAITSSVMELTKCSVCRWPMSQFHGASRSRNDLPVRSWYLSQTRPHSHHPLRYDR